MKKILLLLNILVIVLILSNSCKNGNGMRHETNIITENNIDINVLTSKIFTTQKYLYGFSTASMYQQINASDEKFIDCVNNLNPQILRWPAGAMAQYYHWNKPGYGYDRNEINKYNSNISKNIDNQNGFADKNKNITKPYIDNFISLVQKTKSKVIVCANMLTGNELELKEMLEYFKKNKVDVVAVEMGNEFYLPKQRKYFPDAGSYLNTCKKYLPAVKFVFPKAKIGVVAAPYTRISNDELMSSDETNYFKQWNIDLAKEKIYDAYISHYYFPIDCNKEDEFKCAMNANQENINTLLPNSIEYYTKLFGSKKLWITEWNIEQRKTNGIYGNTLLQSLFIQEFYHTVNELNRKYNSIIEVATYQTLAGSIIGSCCITNAIGKEKESDLMYEPFIRRSSYFAHDILKNIYTDSLSLVNVTSATSNKKDINSYAYINKSKNRLYIYLYNNNNEIFKLKSLTVDGKIIDLNNITISSQESTSPKSGIGYNKSSGAISKSIPIILTYGKIKENVLANSFACILLEINL
jgi:hypothetical protein